MPAICNAQNCCKCCYLQSNTAVCRTDSVTKKQKFDQSAGSLRIALFRARLMLQS